MALDFDAVDDQVSHGDANAMDGIANLTFTAWINPDTNPDTGRLVISAKTADNPTHLAGSYTNSNSLSSRLNADGISHTDANTITLTVWQHVAMEYDGARATASRILYYINGILVTSNHTGNGHPATLPSNAANWTIGGAGGQYWDGRIALVKAWTASLTAAEIVQEMNSFRPVRMANLVLWSPYDDGTNARDYSGNENHGVVTGALQAPGPPVSYGGQVRRWRRGPDQRLWRRA